MIAEIAVASEQQSQGVDQINASIEQLNKATQQVATNAQESSSATVELTGQARELQSMILKLRLSEKSEIRIGMIGTAPYALQADLAPALKATRPPKKGNGSCAKGPTELIPFEDKGQEQLEEF